MRRIFRITLVLMGGLLLMMTGIVGQARQSNMTSIGWAVLCCQTKSNAGALYLWEPTSGLTKRLSLYNFYVEFLTGAGDWFYYGAGSSEEGASTLYRVQLNGTSEQLIEDILPIYPLAQSISSDGRWLVVYQYYQSSYKWFSVQTATGAVYSLSDDLEPLGYLMADYDFLPKFSPDGQWIAFEAGRADGRLDTFRVHPDGTGLENLTAAMPQALMSLEWLGDDLFIYDPQHLAYYLFDPATHQTKRLFGFDQWPDLARVHVFAAADSVLVDGDNFTSYHLMDLSEIWHEREAVTYWSASPQARQLFLTTSSEWVMRHLDSTKQFRFPAPLTASTIEATAWSPDEQAVAVRVYTDTHEEIWQVDALHGPQKIWSTADTLYDMAWSPDGRSLGIIGYAKNTNEVVYLPADGNGVKVRTEANFKGWGPTIDRPLNGNRLVVIGVLIAGVGLLAPRIAPTIIRRRVGPF